MINPQHPVYTLADAHLTASEYVGLSGPLDATFVEAIKCLWERREAVGVPVLEIDVLRVVDSVMAALVVLEVYGPCH